MDFGDPKLLNSLPPQLLVKAVSPSKTLISLWSVYGTTLMILALSSLGIWISLELERSSASGNSQLRDAAVIDNTQIFTSWKRRMQYFGTRTLYDFKFNHLSTDRQDDLTKKLITRLHTMEESLRSRCSLYVSDLQMNRTKEYLTFEVYIVENPISNDTGWKLHSGEIFYTAASGLISITIGCLPPLSQLDGDRFILTFGGTIVLDESSIITRPNQLLQPFKPSKVDPKQRQTYITCFSIEIVISAAVFFAYFFSIRQLLRELKAYKNDDFRSRSKPILKVWCEIRFIQRSFFVITECIQMFQKLQDGRDQKECPLVIKSSKTDAADNSRGIKRSKARYKRWASTALKRIAGTTSPTGLLGGKRSKIVCASCKFSIDTSHISEDTVDVRELISRLFEYIDLVNCGGHVDETCGESFFIVWGIGSYTLENVFQTLYSIQNYASHTEPAVFIGLHQGDAALGFNSDTRISPIVCLSPVRRFARTLSDYAEYLKLSFVISNECFVSGSEFLFDYCACDCILIEGKLNVSYTLQHAPPNWLQDNDDGTVSSYDEVGKQTVDNKEPMSPIETEISDSFLVLCNAVKARQPLPTEVVQYLLSADLPPTLQRVLNHLEQLGSSSSHNALEFLIGNSPTGVVSPTCRLESSASLQSAELETDTHTSG